MRTLRVYLAMRPDNQERHASRALTRGILFGAGVRDDTDDQCSRTQDDGRTTLDVLHPSHFAYRHIGPRRADVEEMLELLGYESLEHFIDEVVPEEIRLRRPLALPPGRSEREVLQALRGMAGMNRVFRSYIGMGYAGCFTPQVIQRNVLENPGWYTAYTPYQAEIAQGRLEALLNFQTWSSDLTGLEIANASLLDEATAAAEAMNLSLARAAVKSEPVVPRVDELPPADHRVVQTRAEARGSRWSVGDPAHVRVRTRVFGALRAVPRHRRRGPRLPRSSASGRTPAARWSPPPPTSSA